MTRFLLFLLTVSFLIACQNPAPVTRLKLSVTDLEDDTQFVVEGPGYEKEFDLDGNDFQDTLMITQPGLYIFSVGWRRLHAYVTPGETVRISGDAKTLLDEGIFADEDHQKVASYFQRKRRISNEHLSMRDLYGMSPDSFLVALDNGRGLLEENLAQADLPESVAKEELAGLGYRDQELKHLFPTITGTDPSKLPAALQDPLSGLNLNDNDLFERNPSYASLVKQKFKSDLILKMDEDTTKTYDETVLTQIAALPEGTIRNSLLYRTMKYLTGPNEKLEDYMDFFRQYNSNRNFLARMEQQYADFQPLLKGNPSPSFHYENHKGGKTKLEDFRGKYVYVDVWATWCGPCIGEIPSLKAKEAKYHDANIEFVSISIDEIDDKEKWQEIVDKYELGGTQLMVDNGRKSDILQNYMITSIPRFLLIDPEGNIVTADAPRPSDDELDDLFAEVGL